MTRKILVAVTLALLIPVGAMASQFGLNAGFFGQSTTVDGLPGSSVSAFTIGPVMYSENYLLDLGMSFVMSSSDVSVAAPAYGGFGMGYMFGHDATKPRLFLMGGLNVTMEDSQFKAGPKISGGLSKSIEDATLVIVGPEMYYTLADKTVGYRIIGKFVFKLGTSTPLPTRAGAGGQTPRGLFPAS